MKSERLSLHEKSSRKLKKKQMQSLNIITISKPYNKEAAHFSELPNGAVKTLVFYSSFIIYSIFVLKKQKICAIVNLR